MEATFSISSSSVEPTIPTQACEIFQNLSEMLCRECGGGCKGFMLTDELEKYQDHPGPKIGWFVEGPTVRLRLANCKAVERLDRISQFLKLYGMSVTHSQMVH
jgi:hypothetical protein